MKEPVVKDLKELFDAAFDRYKQENWTYDQVIEEFDKVIDIKIQQLLLSDECGYNHQIGFLFLSPTVYQSFFNPLKNQPFDRLSWVEALLDIMKYGRQIRQSMKGIESND